MRWGLYVFLGVSFFCVFDNRGLLMFSFLSEISYHTILFRFLANTPYCYTAVAFFFGTTTYLQQGFHIAIKCAVLAVSRVHFQRLSPSVGGCCH